MRRADYYAVALLALVPSGAAHAACSVSATGVAFGQYDPRAVAPRDSAGTVTAACSNTEQDVRVSASSGTSGNFAQRRLSNGASILGYNLYTSASRSQVLGDGSGGTGTISLGRVKDPVSRTVYGRIPAGQNVTAGAYTDTLILTVTF